MKRNIKSLTGYTIGATDGEIGKINEFYFDDSTWTIRYLVVETGTWLAGRKVLISPEAFLTPDWNHKIFYVNLTKDQIRHSPDIDTAQTVTREEEIKLNQHYPWKRYWEGALWGGGGGMGTTGMVLPSTMDEEALSDTRPMAMEETNTNVYAHHLRGTREVTGNNIKATDGAIGEVEDFIVDEHSWEIDFIVVDTGNWFPGKKVLISPKWIQEIDWQMSTVVVRVTVDDVKHSPGYDHHQPISDEYADKLHDYYDGGGGI